MPFVAIASAASRARAPPPRAAPQSLAASRARGSRSACRQGRARRRQAKPGKPYSLPPEIRSSASRRASSARERRPSLRYEWVSAFSTVCTLTNSSAATSRFVLLPRRARRRDARSVSSSREAARPPIRDSSARARSAQSGALHSSKSVRAASSALAPRAFALPPTNLPEDEQGSTALERLKLLSRCRDRLLRVRRGGVELPSYRGDERLAPAQRSRRARVTSPADVRLEPGEHSFRLSDLPEVDERLDVVRAARPRRGGRFPIA